MGEPREGEERFSKLFFVHTKPQKGMMPVYEYWHKGNQEYNLHTGKPWGGEVKGEIQFYAYRTDPAADRRYFLKKVALKQIKAKTMTKVLGASVSLDDLSYDDFSTHFEATKPDEIVSALISE